MSYFTNCVFYVLLFWALVSGRLTLCVPWLLSLNLNTILWRTAIQIITRIKSVLASHIPHPSKRSAEFVDNFSNYLVNRQTDRRTDRQTKKRRVTYNPPWRRQQTATFYIRSVASNYNAVQKMQHRKRRRPNARLRGSSYSSAAYFCHRSITTKTIRHVLASFAGSGRLIERSPSEFVRNVHVAVVDAEKQLKQRQVQLSLTERFRRWQTNHIFWLSCLVTLRAIVIAPVCLCVCLFVGLLPW